MQGYEFTIAEMGNMDSYLIGPDFEISLQENRHKYRLKKESCKKCRYYKICLGPWKRYVRMFGFDEFRPVEGKMLDNANELMLQGYRI